MKNEVNQISALGKRPTLTAVTTTATSRHINHLSSYLDLSFSAGSFLYSRLLHFAPTFTGKAFDGAAIDPKVLQKQQEDLQKQLEERAKKQRQDLEKQNGGAAPVIPPAAPKAP